MIDYSLNETASRAKLAAKGVGYSWGMAEEVARAMHWLVSRELPGPAMLHNLLSCFDSSNSIALAIPGLDDGHIRSKHTWVCPFAAGCALSDTCIAVDDHTLFTFVEVKCPILLLPFVADIAQRTDRVLTLASENQTAVTDGNRFWLSSNAITQQEQIKSVNFRVANGSEVEAVLASDIIECRRVIVETAVWDALGMYAHLTYAPSTQSSRALGAGAGLNDND